MVFRTTKAPDEWVPLGGGGGGGGRSPLGGVVGLLVFVGVIAVAWMMFHP
jgi:hypothetical protein